MLLCLNALATARNTNKLVLFGLITEPCSTPLSTSNRAEKLPQSKMRVATICGVGVSNDILRGGSGDVWTTKPWPCGSTHKHCGNGTYNASV